ncbi:hypothetical protein HDV05_000260, partial [Chytridiales sp. JEL 0842]
MTTPSAPANPAPTAAPATPSPASSTSSSKPTKMREEAIELAVRFLKDPKVQQATLAKRISFLESKGLTSEEIEEALSRTNGTSSTSSPSSSGSAAATAPQAVTGQVVQQGPPSLPPGNPAQQQYPVGYPYPPQPGAPGAYGYPYPQQPQQHQQGMGGMMQRMDWRDYTLGVIGIAAVGYGAISLGKKYVLPYLTWPTDSKLLEETKALESQVQKATEAVEVSRKETTEALVKFEKESSKISESLDALRGSIVEIALGAKKREEEVKGIQDDIDTIKQMLPK